MTPADLAAMLDVMAQALRAMPTPQGMQSSQSVTDIAGQQRTVADWIQVYEQLLKERGYKAQTLKNRTAHLRHVRRLWGQVPMRALRPHAISVGLKEFLPARSSTASSGPASIDLLKASLPTSFSS